MDVLRDLHAAGGAGGGDGLAPARRGGQLRPAARLRRQGPAALPGRAAGRRCSAPRRSRRSTGGPSRCGRRAGGASSTRRPGGGRDRARRVPRGAGDLADAAPGVAAGRRAARLPGRLRGAAADRLRLGGAHPDLHRRPGLRPLARGAAPRRGRARPPPARHGHGVRRGGRRVLLGSLRPRRLPAEAVVGGAWVAASAAVVLGVSRLVHAAHDLGGMVFGNAVAVPDEELWIIGGGGAPLRGASTSSSRRRSPSSPSTTRRRGAQGVRTWLWDGALSVTLGLAIPASARALGALPVFAFLTLPAAAALLLRVRLGTAFLAGRRLRRAGGRRGLPGVLVRRDAHRRHHGGRLRPVPAARGAGGEVPGVRRGPERIRRARKSRAKFPLDPGRRGQ